MNSNDTKIYPTIIEKSTTHTNYTYNLSTTDRLSKAFDVLPSNSIINKGRCGIGGTYIEIMAKRNSIIIVPTNAIIDDKCLDSNNAVYPNYFIVRGKKKTFKSSELKAFIESDIPYKKIFSTPAGLLKIITCGASQDDIYGKWFLLLDESHTAITDSFRTDVIKPFRHLFDFAESALISATPYRFSDPRLKTFDNHNIIFDDKIGTVKIINTTNVLSTLYLKLSQLEHLPGRVHIFLNSIQQIASIIKMRDLTGVSIFCSDIKKNRDNLAHLACYIKDKPCETAYSKFNFYTSKYFEGWDLEDANSTTIIVSDYTQATLRSGVSNKCIQAAGRNRFASNEIIHITNNRNLPSRESFEAIEAQTLLRAKSTIRLYNEHVNESKGVKAFSPDKEFAVLLDKYSDNHNRAEGIPAILNHFKVDQIVNEDYCDQEFNNVTYIKEAWASMGYRTILKSVSPPDIPNDATVKNKTHGVEAVISYLDALNADDEDDLMSYQHLAPLLPESSYWIRRAYYELGPDRLRILKGDRKLIRREVLFSEFENKKPLIAAEYYKLAQNDKKPIDWIVKTLSKIYEDLGVYDYTKINDLIKVAKAAQLNKYFTKAKPGKMEDLKTNCYEIEIY